MTTGSTNTKRFGLSQLWNSFERVGWLGGAAALLLAVLLGMIWSVFFWVCFISGTVILVATRRADRISPSGGIVAPVDGRLVSVEDVVPPVELKIGTEPMTRLRISSAPGKVASVWSPQDATFASLIIEEGDPQNFYAGSADKAGLRKAYMGFEAAGGDLFGVALVTGALGPRIDVDIRMGSEQKLGDHIAKRRLGGWCDLYLPTGVSLDVLIGQVLVGGETRLVREAVEAAPASSKESSDTLEDIVEEPLEATNDDAAIDDVSEDVDTDITETATPEAAEDDETPDAAAARMFERLKRETKKKKKKSD